MISDCQNEYGYSHSRCREMVNDNAEMEELESIDHLGEEQENATVEAATTILLFTNMIATIIAAVSEKNKLRPSALAGTVVGIPWCRLDYFLHCSMGDKWQITRRM